MSFFGEKPVDYLSKRVCVWVVIGCCVGGSARNTEPAKNINDTLQCYCSADDDGESGFHFGKRGNKNPQRFILL